MKTFQGAAVLAGAMLVAMAWSGQDPVPAGSTSDDAQRQYTRRFEAHQYGRMSEYIALVEQAGVRNLADPVQAQALALAYDAVGRSAAAAREVQRAYELPGISRGAKYDLARAGQLIAMGAGDRDRLKYWLAETGLLDPERKPTYERLIDQLDQPAEALARQQERLRDPGTSEDMMAFMAPWLAYRGDAAGALQALRAERAATGLRGSTSLWLSVYREVRELPGFWQLAAEIGLVEQWRKGGWSDFCKPAPPGIDCGAGSIPTPREAAAWRQTGPHRSRKVEVEKGVWLEVLDWGGTGRPLVLLAGLGATAHVFDGFAASLTDRYHVYGITRRGFGSSSAPESGYDPDRLGDDVLAVIRALQLDRPVLAGHSLAGEELSSIGSRHPLRVAGLIYLDAAYPYAFPEPVYDAERKARRAAARAQSPGPVPPPELIDQAIMDAQRSYTKVSAPLLAIIAGQMTGTNAEADARLAARAEAQQKAILAAAPTASIVYLPMARHDVFISNEEEVLREMRAFIEGLR